MYCRISFYKNLHDNIVPGKVNSMKLFIAEKPSVGRELAKNLSGPITSHNGYIYCGKDVVTWAYGHILQQAEPHAYQARYKYWRREDLPIIPQTWKLLISPTAKKQFAIIKQLIHQADSIVHAGDPDREGQLLIDEILEFVENKKPVQRILLNALDKDSIQYALAHVQDNANFTPLRDSALARSRADWLIGMNLSRAYTLAAQEKKHKRVVFPIGRVKTPTLALVVRRQQELDHFIPLAYYGIKIAVIHQNGMIHAVWKPNELQSGLDEQGRCLKKDEVTVVLKKIQENPIGTILSYSTKKKKEMPPFPLSLSDLQILAGKRYGYEPQQVLEAAQALYEKKVTTYPRSDCNYLPLNQWKDRTVILQNLQRISAGELSIWSQNADLTVRSLAWNDKKITAHHAIIPTKIPCSFSTLTSIQQHIYYLIAQAYIAQFYKPYEYDSTQLQLTMAAEIFIAHGKAVREWGWKALYQQYANTNSDEKVHLLPSTCVGDKVTYESGTVEKKMTKPPSRFTAASLVGAMKEIYKYVKDERLKKILKEVQGIGTEATRAIIIKELIDRKFLKEEGRKKYLIPTDIAYELIEALPDALRYPDATAIWENRLQNMSQGKENLQSFLVDQIEFLQQLLLHVGITFNPPHNCPRCSRPLRLRKGPYGNFYGCSGYPTCTYTEKLASK